MGPKSNSLEGQIWQYWFNKPKPKNAKMSIFVIFLQKNAPATAHARHGSRQGGPAPSISTFVFFSHHFGTKNHKMSIFVIFLKMDRPSQGGFGPQGAPWGPKEPKGPKGSQGAQGSPKGLRLSTIVSPDSVRTVGLSAA